MSDAPHPLGSTRKRVEEVYEESRRKYVCPCIHYSQLLTFIQATRERS